MIKINNEKELMSILKIISEESVKKSKSIVLEGKDEAQQRYAKELRAGEHMYGVSLSEKEEVNDEKQDSGSEEEAKAQKAEPEEREEEVKPEELESSFDNVLKNINNLRAGRSTKDKEIKAELLEYYERLDEDEKKILFLFLRELSKILRGALDGSEAADPSDAPHYAEVTFGDAATEQDSQKDKSTSTATQTDGEGEDNFPPIKVNESQNLNEIRKKFNRMLKRY